MGASVWSELRERVAQYDSQTSDMRLCGRRRVPSGLVKAKQGSSVTRGDANENDDVLACASTDAKPFTSIAALPEWQAATVRRTRLEQFAGRAVHRLQRFR
jgi:hypothetical protein